MPSMSGAQALIRSLAREGVEVIFALPGVQIMHAFDANGQPQKIPGNRTGCTFDRIAVFDQALDATE